MKKHLLFAALFMMTAWGCTSEQSVVYKDASANIEDRVEDLLGQ